MARELTINATLDPQSDVQHVKLIRSSGMLVEPHPTAHISGSLHHVGFCDLAFGKVLPRADLRHRTAGVIRGVVGLQLGRSVGGCREAVEGVYKWAESLEACIGNGSPGCDILMLRQSPILKKYLILIVDTLTWFRQTGDFETWATCLLKA